MNKSFLKDSYPEIYKVFCASSQNRPTGTVVKNLWLFFDVNKVVIPIYAKSPHEYDIKINGCKPISYDVKFRNMEAAREHAVNNALRLISFQMSLRSLSLQECAQKWDESFQ